ncbi:ABC transporter ATP-binding protein [Nostoc sp. ChiQUE01b]|uniref:ABC transporter ATP-binding protein n=1 Tax=Nostoc sp. ChiQUE01b TaxID=3075376 RepID=UPI002AD56266|nr:ABC transporter ATP-binding protein [Nostoc sp. ChiQUE01b]MDZ8260461.1 ABC transporter ATP-binding protein [Nostoc sp. ChiQUE01b]
MFYTLISSPGLILLLRFSLSFFHRYWVQGVLLLLALLFQLAFDLLLPFAYKFIFDRLIPTGDTRFLALLLGGLVVAFIIHSLASISQDYLSALIGSGILKDIRLKMFNHLQHLCLSFYTRVQMGELMSRFSSDVIDIERAIAIYLPKGIHNIFLMILSTLLLFVVEWRLALVTLVALPIIFIGPHLFGKQVTSTSYRFRQDEAKVLSTIQENINAQPVIRNFGLQKLMLFKFQEQLVVLSHSSLHSNFFSLLLGRFSLLSIYFLQILIFGVGAFLAIYGYLTTGALVGFLSLLINVNVAVDGITQQVPALIQATTGILRVKQLLAEQSTITDAVDAVPLPPLAKEIRFEDVTFSYSGVQANLDKVSFTIRVGQSVAFVGPSGSGKSTVLNLLMRFYDPNHGSMLFDGHDLRQVSQASLRTQISAVFQETFLFNTTIRENICLGKPDATDAEIEAAAKAAEIHDTILSFPQKYDTCVGERGGQISGGQRQRIAIARAILRNPAVLVLDEATSSLDPESESAINTTLLNLARGRTVISVTHRLTSVVKSDCIFVLEGGKLIEQGTHEELLNLRGLYYRLWWKQSQ